MKVIDRILYKKVVSGDRETAITEETNRGSQQGLLFKHKKRLKDTNKIETT